MVGRARLADHGLAMAVQPAAFQPGHHAHRLDHLGIPQRAFGKAHGDDVVGGRLGQRLAGGQLVDQGHGEQYHRTGQGDEAQHRMHDEHDGQEDRCPRRVEQRQQPLPGQERSERVQIAQRLGLPRAGITHRAFDQAGEHVGVQFMVQLAAQADQDAGAHMLQQRAGQDQAAGGHGQEDQRRDAARRQHPVVDLQHVQRPDQHQQIDEEAEHADDGKHRPRPAQCLAECRYALWPTRRFSDHRCSHPLTRLRPAMPPGQPIAFVGGGHPPG